MNTIFTLFWFETMNWRRWSYILFCINTLNILNRLFMLSRGNPKNCTVFGYSGASELNCLADRQYLIQEIRLVCGNHPLSDKISKLFLVFKRALNTKIILYLMVKSRHDAGTSKVTLQY